MVYSVRIMVDEIEFAESKSASGGGNDGGYNNGFGGGFGGSNSNVPAPSGADDGFMNIPDGIDEELPFN